MFVKAIEGETNATVLDPAFRRKADPPSIYESAKTRGIPAIAVASLNRPQITTNPRAANPYAASDLKGQERLNMALDRVATNQARIIARERRAATKREKQILSSALSAIRRNRERQGLGEQPLLTTGPEPAYGTTPIDPVAIAQKVAAGQKLSQQEFAVWEAQSPLARGVWTILPQVQPGKSSAGDVWAKISAWLESETFPGVKNMYLAGGAGLLAVVISAGKRRRR